MLFLSAIQFVLSDEFSHMGSEERQQLLHVWQLSLSLSTTAQEGLSAWQLLYLVHSNLLVPALCLYMDKKHVSCSYSGTLIL